jgi:hypothetical protein
LRQVTFAEPAHVNVYVSGSLPVFRTVNDSPGMEEFGRRATVSPLSGVTATM